MDQYVPFTRPYQELPALFVDQDLGAKVVAMAKRKETGRLRHLGTRLPDSMTTHLVATLSAPLECRIDDQAIVVTTHTDGPNRFEENGVIALWSLLREFARDACRRRDLIFVFAAGHFAREVGSTDDVIVWKQLNRRTRAAVAIEHLGALRSSADGKNAGRTEPTLVLTTALDGELKRAAAAVFAKHAKCDKSLRPMFFIQPKYFDYGEGAFLAKAGIPTVGYLTNPSYLLQTEPVEPTVFSTQLMREQIAMFRDLVEKMMNLESLKR